MKFKLEYLTILIASGLFLSGCYTQVKTVHSDRGYYPASTQPAPDRRAPVEQRQGQIVNEDDYVLGYEDGWDDSEEYYFKDYEAKEWYLNYGIDLAHDRHVRRSYSTVQHHYYYPYHFSSWYTPPFYRYYGPTNYGHSYFAFQFYRPHFSIGFGWGFHDPYRFYYDPYSYYGGYYSGYWGYNSGYYGRPVIVYNTRTVQRDYGPRSTGLATRGNVVRNRTASVQNSRSAIRSNARSTQVTRSRSTVNQTRSSSSIRSRSTSRTNSRSTVNRSRTNTNRSSGTVNRTRSNNNSSGSVNRSRSSSNNRSTGNVNRNRSSSNNRSSGSVSRSNSSSRSSGASTNRSRSNNNDSQRATIGSTSSRTSTYVTPRSEENRISVGTNTTINRRSVVFNRSVNRTAVNRRTINATVPNRIANSNSRQNRSSGFLRSLGRALGNAALEGITNSRRSSSSSGVNRTRSSSSSSRSTVNRSSNNNRSSSGSVKRSSSNNRSSSGSSSRKRSSSSSNNRN